MQSDSSIWQLYRQALSNWAHVTGSDVLSVAAIDTFSDLGSPDTGLCNWSIYQLGNGIPSPTGSYAPHSGLFSSYWIYLSYLLQDVAPVPVHLQENASAPPPQVNFERYRQLLLTTLPPQTAIAQNGLCPASSTPSTTDLAAVHQSMTSTFINRAPQIIKALNQCWLASLQEPTALNMVVSTADATASRCPGFTLEQWAQTLPSWRGSGLSALRSNAPTALLNAVDIVLPSVPDSTLGAQLLTTADLPSFIGLNLASPMHTAMCSLANLSNTSVTMSLSLEQFGSFALSPAAWFDADFFDGSRYIAPPNAADFFSENGAIGLLPSHAVIGFRPHLTLRVSNLAKAQDLANSVTRIGPFNLQATATVQLPADAGGSSGEVDIHFDAQDSNLPVLLGVISRQVLH
ncbi:hypothetical protein [Pseudomonas farris]